MDAATPVID
jgi:hypothetical protein